MTERVIGPTGSKRRRRFMLGPLLLVAACALMFTAGAQAVHDDGVFELDKNAADDPRRRCGRLEQRLRPDHGRCERHVQ